MEAEQLICLDLGVKGGVEANLDSAVRNGAPIPGLGGSRPAGVGQVSVSVVIPALNEEGSIGWVLERIPSWVDEVILVDGRSTDQTEAIARATFPDIVVVHQHQPGKGAALRAGFAAATGAIVVMLDADGSTDPNEIPRFVEALEAGSDFVKGSRHLDGGGSVDFTPLRQVGNRAFVMLANFLFRRRFTDLCYGYCAFWRRHLQALALSADGFEIETQLVLNAVKAGLSIAEVPSVELERRAGSSKLNAFTDGHRVLKTMVRERIRRVDRVGAPAPRLELLEVLMAAPDSATWLPAGHDRRRPEHHQASGRPGEERRAQPARTAKVHRAISRPREAAAVGGRSQVPAVARRSRAASAGRAHGS